MIKISYKYIILCIIFWILATCFDLFIAENIDYRETDKKPLADVIHRNFTWWPKTELLPTIMVAIIIIYCCIRIFYMNTNIYCLLFITLGVLLLLRILVYTSTMTPSAKPFKYYSCKQHLLNYVGLSFSKERNTCVDNMFSGHATTFFVPLMLIMIFSKIFYEKVILGIISIVLALLIITSRMHYTADVLVAAGMSLGFIYLIKNIFEKNNIRFT